MLRKERNDAGVTQRIVFQLPKLDTRVRLPSPAPNFAKARMRFLLLTFLVLSLTGCATAPHAAPITEVRPFGGMYHEVKSGETLWRISKLYSIDLDTLVNANSIQDTSMLTKGQRLFIPGVSKKREDFKYSATIDSF